MISSCQRAPSQSCMAREGASDDAGSRPPSAAPRPPPPLHRPAPPRHRLYIKRALAPSPGSGAWHGPRSHTMRVSGGASPQTQVLTGLLGCTRLHAASDRNPSLCRAASPLPMHTRHGSQTLRLLPIDLRLLLPQGTLFPIPDCTAHCCSCRSCSRHVTCRAMRTA